MTRTIVSFIQNGYFLLFTFATGVFYFSFYLVALTLGFSLSFTVAGVPLITHVLRTTSTFLQFERIQTKIYTDITTTPCVNPLSTNASIWLQAKREMMNRSNWMAIGWLMLKFPIGVASLIMAVMLYVLPLVVIVFPYLFPIINISIMDVPIDNFAKSVLVSAVGVALMMVSSRLAGRLTRMLGHYTRLMMNSVNR